MRFLAIPFLLATIPSPACAQVKPAPKADPTAEVFKITAPLQTFKITLDEANLKALKAKPKEYVHCTVVVGDKTYKDVGIHLKGAVGSFQGWDGKPALTLNFDHFVKGQTLSGLDKFHLNNSVQDGGYLNEIACSELARAMGLPTARACHAVVELNGRKMGLYVLKEGYNGHFVERNFPGATGGNLYDGGFLTDIDGKLKLDAGPGCENKDLKALADACKIGDAKKRYEAVAKLVDVDLFAKNAALQFLATDWDGYVRNRNNYRVYFPPKDGKAVFIPHGMDQMFNSPNEAIWPGPGALVSRAILEHEEGRKKTLAAYRELTEKHFTPEFLKRMDEWIAHTRDGLAKSNKDWAKSFEDGAKGDRDRMKQRMDYLKKELPKLK
jgi:spore coat protein H